MDEMDPKAIELIQDRSSSSSSSSSSNNDEERFCHLRMEKIRELEEEEKEKEGMEK